MSALWGACVGPLWTINSRWYQGLKALCLVGVMIALLLSVFYRRKTITLTCLTVFSGFLWAFIHSSPQFSSPQVAATVIWASGCRSFENDLLLEFNGEIYLARGKATTGDRVVLGPKYFGHTRDVEMSSLPHDNGSMWCQIGETVRSKMTLAMARFPRDINVWLRNFVLGDKEVIDRAMFQKFKDVGLLHVLVLSGGHLMIITTFVSFLLRLPVLPFYVLRRVHLRTWASFWGMTQVAVIAIVGVFCLAVGFSQSVQRAFIATALVNLAGVLGFDLPPRRKVLAVLSLQFLCFPVNILSLGMLLSWCGSMILIAFSESDYLLSWFAKLKWLMFVQLVFFASSLIFFGRAGVLSPLINFLGHFVFGVLLPFNILGMVLPADWVYQLLIDVNRAVISGVEFAATLQARLPVPMFIFPKALTINSATGRVLIVSLFALLFWLTNFKRLYHR